MLANPTGTGMLSRLNNYQLNNIINHDMNVMIKIIIPDSHIPL